MSIPLTIVGEERIAALHKMAEDPAMLTTLDNPYNPFIQFDEWNAYDCAHGYYSCAYLARIARTSDDLSHYDEVLANEQAIDEICNYNVLGIYVKVRRSSFKDRSKSVNLTVTD